MVDDVSAGVFLHGIVLGWLRFSHQFDSTACAGSDGDRSIFASDLCRIQHTVLRGHRTVDANFIRGLSTGSKFRTYAGKFKI